MKKKHGKTPKNVEEVHDSKNISIKTISKMNLDDLLDLSFHLE
jgi:hypothetical protein